MPRFQSQFVRGPDDGQLMDCYERPRHGQVILMERRRGKQGGLYRWSDALSVWVFERHVRKSDFMEVRK